MGKRWTLEADISAGQLQDLIRQNAPNMLQPGVTDGRYASVTVISDSLPEWMRAIHDQLEALGTYVEIS